MGAFPRQGRLNALCLNDYVTNQPLEYRRKESIEGKKMLFEDLSYKDVTQLCVKHMALN